PVRRVLEACKALAVPRVLEVRETEEEVGLIEKAERLHSFGFGGRTDAREVDVRGDILLARMLEPCRRAAGRLGSRHRVRGEGGQRAGGMRGRIQLASLVTVVDQDDEASSQTPRRRANPGDRVEIDLG